MLQNGVGWTTSSSILGMSLDRRPDQPLIPPAVAPAVSPIMPVGKAVAPAAAPAATPAIAPPAHPLLLLRGRRVRPGARRNCLANRGEALGHPLILDRRALRPGRLLARCGGHGGAKHEERGANRPSRRHIGQNPQVFLPRRQRFLLDQRPMGLPAGGVPAQTMAARHATATGLDPGCCYETIISISRDRA